MQAHVRAPGMQDRDHSGQCTEKLMVFTKTLNGLPGSIEQQGVDHFRLLKAQPIEMVGQGKYHVEVRYINQLIFPVLYPLFPLVTLALRTMSVSAAIVTQM